MGSTNPPLCWDWGIAGFRKIINIIHTLSGANPEDFESFYESKILHKEDIVPALAKNNIIDQSPQMLYVFKQGTKKIPAFTATIHGLAWRSGRIFITFQPTRYMLLDPNTWTQFRERLFSEGREDPQKWFNSWNKSWNVPKPSLTQLQMMLHSSSSQDQYHIIPYRFLTDSIQQGVTEKRGTCFIKEITKATKRLKFQVSTDNQVFWGLLSEFIGRSQVKGTAEIRCNNRIYMLTEIPANTISEDSLVFQQEVGTARTICQVMLDVFGEEYLSVEFPKDNLSKKLLDSKFLKRAVQVAMVTKSIDSKYAETDFDYEMNLELLPKLTAIVRRKKILFDLTAGLWNKGIGKTKEEFVEQWQHNLAKVPEKNKDLIVVWHYGLREEIKDGTYQGLELGEYIKSKANVQVVKYEPGSITGSKSIPQLVLLPFFRDSATRLETELRHISSDKAVERRRSKLYGALKELLERLIE